MTVTPQILWKGLSVNPALQYALWCKMREGYFARRLKGGFIIPTAPEIGDVHTKWQIQKNGKPRVFAANFKDAVKYLGHSWEKFVSPWAKWVLSADTHYYILWNSDGEDLLAIGKLSSGQWGFFDYRSRERSDLPNLRRIEGSLEELVAESARLLRLADYIVLWPEILPWEK